GGAQRRHRALAGAVAVSAVAAHGVGGIAGATAARGWIAGGHVHAGAGRAGLAPRAAGDVAAHAAHAELRAGGLLAVGHVVAGAAGAGLPALAALADVGRDALGAGAAAGQALRQHRIAHDAGAHAGRPDLAGAGAVAL